MVAINFSTLAKFRLFANLVDKLHGDFLAVEVAIKIQQVNLQDRLWEVTHRWSKTYIGGPVVEGTCHIDPTAKTPDSGAL